MLLVLVAVAVADKRPVTSYGAPRSSERYVEIIRDDRVYPNAEGYYNLDMETENGIQRHESGGEGGIQQGSYRWGKKTLKVTYG